MTKSIDLMFDFIDRRSIEDAVEEKYNLVYAKLNNPVTHVDDFNWLWEIFLTSLGKNNPDKAYCETHPHEHYSHKVFVEKVQILLRILAQFPNLENLPNPTQTDIATAKRILQKLSK